MNEQERAEIVARAIDALLAGADRNTSEAIRDNELNSLLNVAEERLFGSMFIAKASLQHEQEVWNSVVKRIQDAEIEAVTAGPEIEEEDLVELGEVIALRRRMAAEVLALGEAHKDEVWARIQSRLAQQTQRHGVPHFLQRFRRRSDAGKAPDLTAGPPYAAELAPPAGSAVRPPMGQMAEGAQGTARARVWARLATSAGLDNTPRVAVKPRQSRIPALSTLALGAAAAAIAAIAVGPLPATGFADHPAVRLATTIGAQLGVEDATPPELAQLPPPVIVGGTAATVEEASALAGVSFSVPSSAPAGFELTSTTLLSQAVSGNGVGTFVIAYESSDAYLTIYQEKAGGPDAAVAAGSTAEVTLADGTPATLVLGGWLAGEELAWSDSGSQSLIFERDGVRVVIELRTANPSPRLLFQVAESIR